MEILTVIALLVIVGVVLIMKVSTDKIEQDDQDMDTPYSYDSKYEVYTKHNDWHCNRRGRLTDYWENDR